MPLRERLSPYWFVLPALIATTVTTLFPTVYTVWLSFTNWSLNHFTDYRFVGLDNYWKILAGAEIWIFLRVFWWTLIWAASSVAVSLVVGMVFAQILNRKDVRGTYLYRTLLIVPWAMPSFITVLMWQGLLNSGFGQVNQFLKTLMISPVPWLDAAYWARFSVVMVNVWLSFPFMMAIILGALQSIPSDLYEAASIDGASKRTQYWRITVPMLRNAMVPVIITSFSFAFNNFIGIYLLTAGGPPVPGSGSAGATDILVSYTFKLGFNLNQYGLASAYAVVIFFLVGGLSLVNSMMTGAFRDEK